MVIFFSFSAVPASKRGFPTFLKKKPKVTVVSVIPLYGSLLVQLQDTQENVYNSKYIFRSLLNIIEPVQRICLLDVLHEYGLQSANGAYYCCNRLRHFHHPQVARRVASGKNNLP